MSKKDGELWPCQDYQYLNEHTIKNAYPLPLISDLVDGVKGSLIFTKMNVWWYNNIKEGDEWKVVFTPLGLFEPTVILFGMCGSPPTFQAFMDVTFAKMIAEGWLITYMDDLSMIHSDDPDKHEERVQRVLQQMKDNDLHLKLSKYFFNQKEVEYLGLILCPGQVVMDPAKLSTILAWQLPTSVKVICSFLRFCNFYWKFIPDFSKLAQPLNSLTKKGATFF